MVIMGFFSRLTASIQLIKESWDILKKDKELLLYPLVSGIIIIMLFFAMIVPVILTAGASGIFWAFIGFYFIASIIGVFFTASLMASANMRLNGKDSRFSNGIGIALKNLPQLIIWALINATIGLILRSIAEGDNLIAKIISYVIAFAWSFLTLFTIPVIIFEKKNSLSAIKRSGEIFKKTWGESVIGQFSIGSLFVLGVLAGIILVLLALFTGIFALFIIMLILVVIGLIILYLITSALDGIYITALYNYATKKKLPKGFSRDFIKSAFLRK
ncbi:MAG: hypothetical protein HZB65_01335 [Candidatus Aenigmarchaeota archaeon]|nr:hypothetical protein [Candidatus Aenigmarchaeota archaeon]